MLKYDCLGILGHLALDYQFPLAAPVYEGNFVTVNQDGEDYRLFSKERVFPGAKVTVDATPEAFLAKAETVTYGGGGYNSLQALRMIVDAKVRYLDSCTLDQEIRERFTNSGVEARSLDLRSIPRNAIAGNRSNKLIIKSFVDRWQRGLEGNRIRAIAWLAECSAILANSVKDEIVLDAVIALARITGSRVHLVAPCSLSPDFLRSVVLPNVASVVGNWDQTCCLSGAGLERSVSASIERLRALGQEIPDAVLFWTLGSEGVLASAPRSRDIYHIRLESSAWAEAQAVAQCPVHSCGCGDAFAAGMFAWLEPASRFCSVRSAEAIESATSGCISALRWLGWGHPLSSRDFVITPHRFGSPVVAVSLTSHIPEQRERDVQLLPERIVATDEMDESAYPADFGPVHEQGVPHRAVHIEVTDGEGRFLVWRRLDDGRFEIPGGHVRWLTADDRPESYEEAVVREILEEMNLAHNWHCSAVSARARIAGSTQSLGKAINQIPGTEANNNEWVMIFELKWAGDWGDPCSFTLGDECEAPQWLTMQQITDLSIANPMSINTALRLFLHRRSVLIPLTLAVYPRLPSRAVQAPTTGTSANHD